MRKRYIPTPPTLLGDIARFVVAAVFITMTMAFITLPYALSFYPGEAAPAEMTHPA